MTCGPTAAVKVDDFGNRTESAQISPFNEDLGDTSGPGGYDTRGLLQGSGGGDDSTATVDGGFLVITMDDEASFGGGAIYEINGAGAVMGPLDFLDADDLTLFWRFKSENVAEGSTGGSRIVFGYDTYTVILKHDPDDALHLNIYNGGGSLDSATPTDWDDGSYWVAEFNRIRGGDIRFRIYHDGDTPPAWQLTSSYSSTNDEYVSFTATGVTPGVVTVDYISASESEDCAIHAGPCLDCLYTCGEFAGVWPVAWVLQGVMDNTDPFPPGGMVFSWSDGQIFTDTPDTPPPAGPLDPVDTDGRSWSVGIATTDSQTLVTRAFLEQEVVFEATVDISVMPGENYGGILNPIDSDTYIDASLQVEIGTWVRGVNVRFQTDRGGSTESNLNGTNGAGPVLPLGLDIGGLDAGLYTMRLSISPSASTAELVSYGSVDLDPMPDPPMDDDLDMTLINFQLAVGGQTYSATTTQVRMSQFRGEAGSGACPPTDHPAINQRIEDEHLAPGTGTKTVYTTAHAYNPYSLEVHVNGILTDVDTSNPETGEFMFADPPVAGAVIRADYYSLTGAPVYVPRPNPGSPGPGLPPTTPIGPVYGPGVAIDSKSNSRVGDGQKTAVRLTEHGTSNVDTIALNWRWGPGGYSAGTSPVIEVSKQTDAGGIPSGTVIGTPITYSPTIDSSTPTEDMTPLSVPGDWTTVDGRVVHYVQENVGGSPLTHWLSVNHTTVLEGGNGSPAFDEHLAVMTDNYGSGWAVFGDLPVIDVTYADSSHDGNAYFGVIVTSDFSTIALINGSAQARQTLNPTADLTVYSMWVRVKHISGPGSLTITLDGPDIPVVVSGGDIATTPYSSSWTVADLTGGRWVGGAITGGFTLLNGSTYYLRMETVPGTTYLAIPIRVADSPWASYAYYDGEAQKSPDGSSWSSNYGGALNSWQCYLGKTP